MQINQEVLGRVKTADAQLVVVTKYWDAAETQQIITQLKDHPSVVGWGENRTESLESKGLERESVHFVGRLQSRQLSTIVTHCGTIHSLASLKHARILDEQTHVQNLPPLKVFVQVNVGDDPAKEGIAPEVLPQFLSDLGAFKHLQIVGLSTMGWGEFEENTKRQEFRDLMALRNKYLLEGVTSAGTSRDYHLALEEGIDVVRLGRGMVI